MASSSPSPSSSSASNLDKAGAQPIRQAEDGFFVDSKPKRWLSDVAFDRLTITCGPLAQTFFFLWMPASVQLPPISPHFSPETTADHYLRHIKGMEGGIALALLAPTLWAFYVGAINRQLSRIPGVSTTLLSTQCIAGSAAMISMILPPMFFSSVIYRVESRDPLLTELLSDMAWLIFSMGFPPFVAQDLAISSAILSDTRKKPLAPRWVGYAISLLSIGLYPALGVHCVKGGAIAWNGALTFWVGAAAFGAQVSLLVFFLMKAVAVKDEDERQDVEQPRVSM